MQASRLQADVPDTLLAHHKNLEQRGKSAIARVAVDSAESVHGPLRVNDARSLNDLANAMAKVFGWASGSQTVNVHAEKAVIVCDEGRRLELIEQRQRLLGTTEKVVKDA